MRVVNENFETLTEYDLTAGYLVPAVVIREDAAPIDGETKVAWADEDYEEARMYIPGTRPEAPAESSQTGLTGILTLLTGLEQRLAKLEERWT